MLSKKLQKMGAIGYFLMKSDDITRYDLDVGTFYDIKIKGIGIVNKILKGNSSKMFTIVKEDFVKHPKLKLDKMYEIDLVGIKPVNVQDNLNKNPDKLKYLTSKVDKLHVEVHELVAKEKKRKEAIKKIQVKDGKLRA